MENDSRHPLGLRTVMELFDVGPAVGLTVLAGTGLVLLAALVYFIRSAPPSEITISSGPLGSAYQRHAGKYAAILAKNGVKLKVVPSQGSRENLQRLGDPHSKIDVAIVQGGMSGAPEDELMSLGSIAHQPLLVFARKSLKTKILSDLKGKRLAVGAKGSGVREVALALLKANGIEEGGSTPLLDLESDDAAKALIAGHLDAAFIMSESASTDILRDLLRAEGVELLSFRQATAYSRKIEALDVLDLPEGAIDLGANIPDHDVALVGPMVEIIAKKRLHPALVDLLVEAAEQVHNRPGIFQKRGDFPAPIEHLIPMSDEAVNYYKSGKGFLYRTFPFWVASLLTRLFLVFVPVFVVLIPAVRSVPAFFRWRTQAKLRTRYRTLLELEKDFLLADTSEKRAALRSRFDQVEESVNRMRVRAAYADQFYGLRGHIDYVRQLMDRKR